MRSASGNFFSKDADCDPVTLSTLMLASLDARRQYELMPSGQSRAAWGEALGEIDLARSRCGISDLSEVIPTSRDSIMAFLGSRSNSAMSVATTSDMSVASSRSLENSAKSATAEIDDYKVNLVAATSESLFPCGFSSDS